MDDASSSWFQQRAVLQRRFVTLTNEHTHCMSSPPVAFDHHVLANTPQVSSSNVVMSLGALCGDDTSSHRNEIAKEADALRKLVDQARRFPQSAAQLRQGVVECGLKVLAQEELLLGDVEQEAISLLATIERPSSISAPSGETARRFDNRVVPSSNLRRHTDPNITGKSNPKSTTTDVSHRHAMFLAVHGGLTLGWDAADHDAFLRVFLRSTHHSHAGDNAAEVLGDLIEALPHRSPAELSEHLSLYLTHMQFVEEKRQAVVAFREQRRVDEEQLVEERQLRQEHEAAAAVLLAEEQEHKRRVYHQQVREKLTAWRLDKENITAAEHPKQRGEVAKAAISSRVRSSSSAVKPSAAQVLLVHHRRKEPVQSGPILPPPSVSREQLQRDLEKRWEADLARTEQRRGKSEFLKMRANTTRADVIEGLRPSTAAKRSSSSSCSDRSRLYQLTASASARQVRDSVTAASTASGGATNLRGTNTYFTPRTVPVGGHLMSATWCDKGYLR